MGADEAPVFTYIHWISPKKYPLVPELQANSVADRWEHGTQTSGDMSDVIATVRLAMSSNVGVATSEASTCNSSAKHINSAMIEAKHLK